MGSRPPHRKGKKSGNKPAKGSRPPGKKSAPAGSRTPSSLRLRKRPGEEAWELVHPRCARDRQEDLEEVRKMLEAGEVEIATDECRWLLNGCSDCLDAHRILGEIALEAGDLPLARGHFGFAFQLGSKAIEQASVRGEVPYRLQPNQGFLESGKGLAYCLKQLGKPEMAAEAIELMLRCDPSDPLGVKGLLDNPPGE